MKGKSDREVEGEIHLKQSIYLIEEEIRGVRSLFGLDISPPFMQIINAEMT